MRIVNPLTRNRVNSLPEGSGEAPARSTEPALSSRNPLDAQPLASSQPVTFTIAPVAPEKPKTDGDGTRKPKPKQLHPLVTKLITPPVLITAGLAFLAIEAGLWAAIGVLWLVAANLALIGIMFVAVLVWRASGAKRRAAARRTTNGDGAARQGGLLARFRRRPTTTTGGSGPAHGGGAPTAGGGGRGGLRGLWDRARGRGGAPAGGHGAGPGGHGAGHGGGGKRRGFMARFRPSRGGNGGGSSGHGGGGNHGGGGGNPGGKRGRFAGMFRRKNHGGGGGNHAGFGHHVGGHTGAGGGGKRPGFFRRSGRDFAAGWRQGTGSAARTTGAGEGARNRSTRRGKRGSDHETTSAHGATGRTGKKTGGVFGGLRKGWRQGVADARATGHKPKPTNPDRRPAAQRPNQQSDGHTQTTGRPNDTRRTAAWTRTPGEPPNRVRMTSEGRCARCRGPILKDEDAQLLKGGDLVCPGCFLGSNYPYPFATSKNTTSTTAATLHRPQPNRNERSASGREGKCDNCGSKYTEVIGRSKLGGPVGNCCRQRLRGQQMEPVERAPAAGYGNREGNAPMSMPHNEGGSLQRWGRNLRRMQPVLDEYATDYGRSADQARDMATAIRKLAVQGDSELPASKKLVAEIEALASRYDRFADEEDERRRQLRGLAEEATTLGAIYDGEHEVDEARLNGERGGVEREKRADVYWAEQDT